MSLEKNEARMSDNDEVFHERNRTQKTLSFPTTNAPIVITFVHTRKNNSRKLALLLFHRRNFAKRLGTRNFLPRFHRGRGTR